jgi:transcriptional regulator with XRE-family HTH domain
MTASACMSFGTRLRELREETDPPLTQAALAEKAGVSQQLVSALETDAADPSWSTVQKLARALGVSVGAFDEPGGPKKPKKGRGRKK